MASSQQQQQSNPVKPQKIGKPQMSQRDAYNKAMNSAYKASEKANKLGVGWGGEPMPKKQKAVKTMRQPSRLKVEKSVRKTMGY